MGIENKPKKTLDKPNKTWYNELKEKAEVAKQKKEVDNNE